MPRFMVKKISDNKENIASNSSEKVSSQTSTFGLFYLPEQAPEKQRSLFEPELTHSADDILEEEFKPAIPPVAAPHDVPSIFQRIAFHQPRDNAIIYQCIHGVLLGDLTHNDLPLDIYSTIYELALQDTLYARKALIALSQMSGREETQVMSLIYVGLIKKDYKYFNNALGIAPDFAKAFMSPLIEKGNIDHSSRAALQYYCNDTDRARKTSWYSEPGVFSASTRDVSYSIMDDDTPDPYMP